MKKRYVLTYPAEVADQPILYNLIKEYDLKINIIKAEFTSGKEGNLLLEMEAEQSKIKRGLAYLDSKTIQYLPIDKSIRFRHKECVHCGSCTAVCFPGALVMERSRWEIQFDPEKCVACELCTKACPLGLFEIDFGN